ncbi:MAG: hypothetical protein ACKO23_12065 [Gemmataceae bacterium]
MSPRRWLFTLALAMLPALTGCRSWCERHYPCPTPMGYPAAAPVAYPAAAQSCVPCCPPTQSYAAPVAPSNWTSPAPKLGTCVCPP